MRKDERKIQGARKYERKSLDPNKSERASAKGFRPGARKLKREDQKSACPALIIDI